MGDMKDMLRESMSNIKTYGDTSPRSGDRTDRTQQYKGKNLLELEGTYEAAKFGGQNSPRRAAKGSARGSPKNSRIGSPGSGSKGRK